MSVRATLARHKQTILLVLIIVLAARVFIPQLDTLAESIKELASANLVWVALAAVLFLCGMPVLAFQFTALSFKKLDFSITLRVQAATMFISKLLPQGVGLISTNIYYYIKKGHTPSEATAALTMNAITSFIAYIFLIIAALFYSDISLRGIFEEGTVRSNISILGLLFLIAAAITIFNATGIKNKIKASWANFKLNLVRYKERPKAVFSSTVWNGIGTSLNILALICSAKALGVDISFADAFLAYTFGNIAATLVPTPGGLGSAEMGIYSGLVLAGIDQSSAMSITLLYRFVSYWLPTIPGYYFFNSLKKSVFSDYSFKKRTNPKVAT